MIALARKEEKAYYCHGGGTIKGASAAALVRALRASSFDPCESEQQFMNEMSARCKLYSGVIIGTYTRAQFIEDLIRHGFLKEAPQGDAPPQGTSRPADVIPFDSNTEEKG